jgi:hypothetical protein
MQNKFSVGQEVFFIHNKVVIEQIGNTVENKIKYYVRQTDVNLPMWVLEDDISPASSFNLQKQIFNKTSPHLTVVDNFFKNPDTIRKMALEQDYHEDIRWYKGKRTKERFLWPFLKEEFERLLNSNIDGWLSQIANGCFQITGFQDPLVYHSDAQNYAAAIYLTPEAPISAGTSFWKSKLHGCRRPPAHPLEFEKFGSAELCEKADSEIYNQYNFLHSDNWELVDKVGAVYNRLAIWDAKLIHSASTYEGLDGSETDKARMVQLFFFNIS